MAWDFVLPWRRGVEHAVRAQVRDMVEQQVAAATAPLVQALLGAGPMHRADARMLRNVQRVLQDRLYVAQYARLVAGVAATVVVQQQAASAMPVPPQATPPAGPDADTVEFVTHGLRKLGFGANEAKKAAATIPPGCTVEEGVRHALKQRTVK